MKTLVLNAGSSTVKYQVIDTDNEKVLCKGLCERIGIDGRHTHKVNGESLKTEKTMKNQIHIVFGFAINNGRGAKAKSNAKHFKERLPVLRERNFRRSFRKKALVSVCWGRGKYPLDCHFGGELSLVSGLLIKNLPQSILCKNVP